MNIHDIYRVARQEHAWLLRAEGLTLQEIGRRLDITREAARQQIQKFGRRVDRALRETRDETKAMRRARLRWAELPMRRNAGNLMYVG